MGGAGKDGSVPQKSPDVLAEVPPCDDRGDATRASGRKRNRRRPLPRTEDRPDVQEVYVPCPGLTFKAGTTGSKPDKYMDGQYLDDEMSDNNGCHATVASFRDSIYLSPKIRSSSVKRLAGKSAEPNRRSNGKKG